MADKSYICDCKTHTVTQDCSLKPSETPQNEMYWLWAENNKYDNESDDFSNVGKWMIFCRTTQVDKLWEKVKEGIRTGELWHAKVSTAKTPPANHVIIIYTKNYKDIKDVVKVLDYLERVKIKAGDTVIYYKTDKQTYAGVYSGGKQKASIYSSNTVRKLLPKSN